MRWQRATRPFSAARKLQIRVKSRKTGGPQNAQEATRARASYLLARIFVGRIGHFGDGPKTCKNSAQAQARAGVTRGCAANRAPTRGSGALPRTENRRKNRPIGRNRQPAENGRANAATLPPVASKRPVSARIASIGRNAKNAKLGALKPKSPRSTWTIGQAYRSTFIGAMSLSLAQTDGRQCGSRVATVEKHERSLTLLRRSSTPRAGVRGLAPGLSGRITRSVVDRTQ